MFHYLFLVTCSGGICILFFFSLSSKYQMIWVLFPSTVCRILLYVWPRNCMFSITSCRACTWVTRQCCIKVILVDVMIGCCHEIWCVIGIIKLFWYRQGWKIITTSRYIFTCYNDLIFIAVLFILILLGFLKMSIGIYHYILCMKSS